MNKTNQALNSVKALLLGLLLFAAGCNQSGSTSTTNIPPSVAVHSLSAVTVVDSPTEYFYLLADGLEAGLKADIGSLIVKHIEFAKPGDIIHFVRTPDNKWLGTIEVPQKHGPKRFRNREILDAFKPVLGYLKDESDVPDDFRGQLNLPSLVERYWSLRKSDGDPMIILAGTPLYHEPDQPQWSFRGRRYPSVSSINDFTSTLPFRNPNLKPLPETAQIRWLLPSNNWGDSKEHEDRLLEFYRRMFDQEIGGELIRFTANPQSLLGQSDASGFLALPECNDHYPPRILTLPESEPTVAPIGTTWNAPAEVESEIQRVLDSPSQTLFAINWQSGSADTDIDIWLNEKEAHEQLNFKNMKTSFGQLVRDIQHTGSANANDSEFSSWELAIVDKDIRSLDDFEMWLNFYDGGGPANVRLITVYRGTQTASEFRFPGRVGDRANGENQRDGNPSWLPVNLTNIARYHRSLN
ncbi:hypothetical protein [Mariniblastus fucicola]|uniref:Uncharacterized protein n=1 Tax=Mariniblastus fucicola TaxID=980251 RepID=A0A5B9P683_9BACT|nr:hypothetical protein [Mariniblastus fucicola]QEG21039.1 hypothetical protein MFFC18_08910 [Mariniblastus fucicola]